MVVIDRLMNIARIAVPDKELVPLEQVHVLDLAEEGYIKPHVDSIKVRAGCSIRSKMLNCSNSLLYHYQLDSLHCDTIVTVYLLLIFLSLL